MLAWTSTQVAGAAVRLDPWFCILVSCKLDCVLARERSSVLHWLHALQTLCESAPRAVTIPGGAQEPWGCATEGHSGMGWCRIWGSWWSLPTLTTESHNHRLEKTTKITESSHQRKDVSRTEQSGPSWPEGAAPGPALANWVIGAGVGQPCPGAARCASVLVVGGSAGQCAVGFWER